MVDPAALVPEGRDPWFVAIELVSAVRAVVLEDDAFGEDFAIAACPVARRSLRRLST